MGAKPKRIDLDPERDPWAQQPGESNKLFGYFTTYREGGPTRTLAKAAETLALNAGYLRELAGAGQWQVRALAWDRFVSEIRTAEWVEERKQAAKDDAKILRILVGAIGQRLATLDPKTMTFGEAVRALDVVMRHRRALYGDPTEVIALTGPAGAQLAVDVQFEDLPQHVRTERLAELGAAAVRRAQALREAAAEEDQAAGPGAA